VQRSGSALSPRVALRILDLSSSRYHSWRRDEDYALNDVSSCPRTRPHHQRRLMDEQSSAAAAPMNVV